MANLTYRTSLTPPIPGATTNKAAALLSSEVDGNFRSLNTAKLELTDTVSTNTPNTPVRRDVNGDFAANVITVTDINSTSDATLKTDVRVFNGSALLSLISPVQFRWKDSGNVSYGVIAQELEKTLPNLVHENEQGIKNVSYTPMIAILVSAVQALTDEVDILKERIQHLEQTR